MKLEIKYAGGNDLAVDFQCVCPSDLFKGTDIEHIMKQRINLYGYNDSYFFNTVNAEPRQFKCKCGKEYTQQWFNDGFVEVKEGYLINFKLYLVRLNFYSEVIEEEIKMNIENKNLIIEGLKNTTKSQADKIERLENVLKTIEGKVSFVMGNESSERIKEIREYVSVFLQSEKQKSI